MQMQRAPLLGASIETAGGGCQKRGAGQQFRHWLYVIVSAVRDEEEFITATLESVIAQTIPPIQWIIVNDGSRDHTGRILDEYAGRHPWMVIIHRPDRGRRLPGTGVMEAFYAGYERLQSSKWDFIVKLDGDVKLGPEYFETCFERFATDDKLGICGGVIYSLKDSMLEQEVHPPSHVRGAIKCYRHSCWIDIGALIKSPGWDTVDELRANMLGWHTKSFADLKVIQSRPTGAASGSWRDNVKNGLADYVSGYHPLFVLIKCLRRSLCKPYLLKAIAHTCGYLSGYARAAPRVSDKEFIRYVRRQQMRRLLSLSNDWTCTSDCRQSWLRSWFSNKGLK